jgi:hypothetical protein
MLREQCWDELLLPLMTSVLSIAGQHAVSVEGSALLTLVRVDDVLRACACFRPSAPLTIYGFGCIGGQRGLLSSGIQAILESKHDDTSIDEIAISVLHDMILSSAFKISRCAMNHWHSHSVEVQLSEQNISTDNRMDITAKSLSIQLLTLDSVLHALHDCLTGTLSEDAFHAAIEAIKANKISCGKRLEQRSLLSPQILLLYLQEQSTSWLRCDPEDPSVSSPAFQITEDALLALTRVCEFLASELLTFARQQCREEFRANRPTDDDEDDEEEDSDDDMNERDIDFKKFMITPHHILQAVSSDHELKTTFPGLIRQGGFYIPSNVSTATLTEIATILRQEVDIPMRQRMERLWSGMFTNHDVSEFEIESESQSPCNESFFHPFDGSIVSCTHHSRASENEDEDEDEDEADAEDEKRSIIMCLASVRGPHKSAMSSISPLG